MLDDITCVSSLGMSKCRSKCHGTEKKETEHELGQVAVALFVPKKFLGACPPVRLNSKCEHVLGGAHVRDGGLHCPAGARHALQRADSTVCAATRPQDPAPSPPCSCTVFLGTLHDCSAGKEKKMLSVVLIRPCPIS